GQQAAGDEGTGPRGRDFHPPRGLLRHACRGRDAGRARSPRGDDRTADRRPGREGRAARSRDRRLRVRPAMARIEFEPWEPEETVGKIWHAFASRLDADPTHDGARVALSRIGGRLAVLFRGLGGDVAVEIKPVAEETSPHRLGLLRGLGTWRESVPRASYDGTTLRLPES